MWTVTTIAITIARQHRNIRIIIISNLTIIIIVTLITRAIITLMTIIIIRIIFLCWRIRSYHCNIDWGLYNHRWMERYRERNVFRYYKERPIQGLSKSLYRRWMRDYKGRDRGSKRGLIDWSNSREWGWRSWKKS